MQQPIQSVYNIEQKIHAMAKILVRCSDIKRSKYISPQEIFEHVHSSRSTRSTWLLDLDLIHATILLYWALMLELYPDAMIKIIDVRLFKNSSQSGIPSVKYQILYEFTGNCIGDKSFHYYFDKISTLESQLNVITGERITNLVSLGVAELHKGVKLCSPYRCTHMIESTMTFDEAEMVSSWTYSVEEVREIIS
jgi:hypothetical protein